MFDKERHIQIINSLYKNHSISVNDIADKLHVSPSTIRRDLKELEKNGLVERTHGGAIIAQEVENNLNYNTKKTKNYDLKLKIAKMAAEEIKDGDIVLLNSSTITSLMPQFIKARNITVITNSINIIQNLKEKESCDVIVLGGIFLSNAETVEGPTTVNQILTMTYDKMFVGANGIDTNFGFSTASELESASKIAGINQSTETYFLCEHTKFNRCALYKICPLSSATYLITDNEVDQKIIDEYSKHLNIKIAE